MRKQISTSELQVGMVCFEPIRTPHGQILAPAKTVLTKQLINKTKLYRVPFIYIDVEEKKAKPKRKIGADTLEQIQMCLNCNKPASVCKGDCFKTQKDGE
jgi:hypothetical protein